MHLSHHDPLCTNGASKSHPRRKLSVTTSVDSPPSYYLAPSNLAVFQLALSSRHRVASVKEEILLVSGMNMVIVESAGEADAR